MRKVSLQLSKIVGTSTEKGWSQIHTFIPAESEKASQRGQLLAVISLGEVGGGVEAVTVGREIISRLHEEYYGELKGSPLDQLKRAVKKVATEVETKAEVEIAAAAMVGKILYLAIVGQGRLVLRREGKVATIPMEEGAASGYLKDGDIFLLGTGKIFEVVAEGTLRAALAADSPEQATEALVPIIHAHKNGGTIAGLVAEVKEEQEEELQPREEKEKGPVEEKPKAKPGLATIIRTLRQKMIFFPGFKVLSSFIVLRIRPLLFQIRRKIRSRAIYLVEKERAKERSQKTVISVALVLLILLGVSVVLGNRQRKHLGQSKKVETILAKAQAKKEEGEALLELNPLAAKELLFEAQRLIQEVQPDEASNQAVVEFKQSLETTLAKVLREHQVEPKVYFDLELIKGGAKGDDLDVSANDLIILDQGKLAVYSLGIARKESSILAGGEELKGVTQVTAFLPKVFVLTEKGIVQADKETKKQSLVVETDDDWGEIVDLHVFGGNLYLLDKKGEIWKYPGVEGGFGSRQPWLKSETKPNFSNAVSMTIDGVIWILKSDGTILKYVRGVRDAFGVAGLDAPFSNPTAVYTDSEQENLYFLDRGNLRVVVLAKSGEYNSQYSWEGIKEVTGIAASEKEGKILLLSGSKVYEVEIK